MTNATAPVQPPAIGLPLPSETEAAGDLAKAFEYFRQQTGRTQVPAIVRCYSFDPQLLMRMIDFAQPLLFSEGLLGRRIKETIATWISARNRCPYCADSHGYYLQFQGAETPVVQALLDSNLAGLPSRERALLEYLALVNDASWRATPDHVQALIAHGWTPDQIAEALHVATFMGLCNRLANAFGFPAQNLMSTQQVL